MVLLVILVAIAVALPIALAGWRLLRVRQGKEPQPEGWPMRLLVLLAFFAPPIVLQFVLPASDKTQLDGVTSVIVYVFLLLVFWLAMWTAARLVARFAPVSWRATALLALAGEATLGDVPFDPPMTEALSDGVALVDARNEAFPRGGAFIAQVDLPGFRAAWDALDAATRALEGLIADAMRLRTGVAERATATAADARGRLETLRRAGIAQGQTWPA